MGAATTEFFEELGKRGHDPLLQTTSGTVRVDLGKNGKVERWLIKIDNGDIEVSHRREAGDCTISAPADLFDRIATGEENAFAAALRGDVVVGGDTKLLVRLQRLFPSPPRRKRR
jgi:putative sterol carrier protein